MYIRYTLRKNDKLNYARFSIKSQHKATYFLTYGLINVCIVLLALSFFFYYLATPIVIDHIRIPPRDEFGVFMITLVVVFLLVLLAWRYKKQFAHVFQLALMQTNYSEVELWADAKKIRFHLDHHAYNLSWSDIKITQNKYQTHVSVKKGQNALLLLIPNTHFASSNMRDTFFAWKKQEESLHAA